MIKTSQSIKIYRLLICLSLMLIISLHTTNQLILPLISRLEHICYDLRLIATMPETMDERIVIVDIDDKSLLQEGRWPWSRNKLAYLVDMLFDYYNVSLLGFDVVFAEKDTSSGLNLLETLAHNSLANNASFQAVLNKMRSELSYDALFAQSFENRNIILGYFVSHLANKANPSTKLPKAAVITQAPFSNWLFEAKSYGGNLNKLQDSARSGGFFNNLGADSDGVSRRLPLLVNYKTEIHQALSLAIFRQYQGLPPLEFITNDSYGDNKMGQRLEYLKIQSFTIPVDEQGAVLIPYRGKKGMFPYISATDILNGLVDIEKLEHKIVIMGATAAGLYDLRSTPMQRQYPGVEIHANIISGILDQTIKSRPNYIIIYELLLLVMISGIIIFIIPRLSVTKATVIFIGLTVFIFGINLILWVYFNLDSNLATPLLLLYVLFSIQLFFGYFFETRRKNKLGNLFGQYIPPELVEQMNQTDEDFSLKGESKEMTVLFSDIRGFTTLSENLNPQELCELINDILTPTTQIIHQNKGTIDKYIGDAVMAFWNAPVKDNNHAANSVQAGLDILTNLKDLQAEFKEKGLPRIDVGIGINTGIMNVGNMGSQFRTAYTVMGDAVNLGSRLEGLTKYYSVKLIVSETTKRAAPLYVYRELDRVQVKGKKEPVTIYEVISNQQVITADYSDYLNLLDYAFNDYYQQKWIEAKERFSYLHQQKPDDRLHLLYLERIENFIAHPPAKDWNGIFIHTTK
ncbi:MAG: adenylate/guanylate cyclase domain-containing protein [Methylococcales bacterium]|nr:adenylate/guanylate cyclase domain-containing protein [Methylococcales bacterium]